MTALEERITRTMRSYERFAPSAAEVAYLARRIDGVKGSRARGWLAVAASVCAVATAMALLTYTSGLKRHDPTRALGSSQVIKTALLSADGRTITVPATEGGCARGVRLTAIEATADVRLSLTENDSKAEACSSVLVVTHASTKLTEPLGARRLIDQKSGEAITYIPAEDLASPSWLPSGAGAPVSTPLNGWTRTYNFPAGSRTAPLTITENPGRFANPAQFSDNVASSQTVRVHQITAQLVVEPRGARRPVQDFVGWVEGRYAIIVSSSPTRTGQHSLSPRTLMRVARGLLIPSPSP